MGPEIAAIGLKLAVASIERPATKGLARLFTWIAGSEVLITGPARAGKTSFSGYLQHGVLEREMPTPKTVDPHKSASFRVEIGKSNSLELKVRHTVDVPGQLGAMEHARLVAKRKPTALIVILDMSNPSQGKSDNATGPWLLCFCEHLNQGLRRSSQFRAKLKSVVFVGNKADKISADVLSKRLAAYGKIIKTNLPEFYGPEVQEVPILPCVLVQSKHDTSLADSVIVRLAKSLV